MKKLKLKIKRRIEFQAETRGQAHIKQSKKKQTASLPAARGIKQTKNADFNQPPNRRPAL